MLHNTRMNRMADHVLKKGKINPMDFEWTRKSELNKFVILHHVVLGAMSMVIIVRKRISQMIRDVECGMMPLGFMNSANKGACYINF